MCATPSGGDLLTDRSGGKGKYCPTCGNVCTDEDGSFEELFADFERKSAESARRIASPLTGMIADREVASGFLDYSDFGNN